MIIKLHKNRTHFVKTDKFGCIFSHCRRPKFQNFTGGIPPDPPSKSSRFALASPPNHKIAPRSLLTSAVCTKDQLKLYCLNAQSLRKKTAYFVCYAYTTRADIFAVTETCFTQRDIAHRIEATPPGFKLFDKCRTGRRGGGTALIVRDSLSVKKVDAGEKTSFEFSDWIVDCGCRKLRILIIYRIPYSPEHPV